MSPIVLPLAAITVMLWIIWSDSLRRRPFSKWFYYVRGLLFVGVSAVLLYNLFRYPDAYSGAARIVVVFAVLVAFLGVGYFVRRAAKKS